MGLKDFVLPAAMAYVAAGADGVMVEAHPNPEDAMSDGQQTIDYDQLVNLIARLKKLSLAIGRDA
jgi:3-deoxy-7-phosphoheptulonate synthase